MGYEKLENDVIKKGLCTRCGVCVGVCPVQVIELNDELFPSLVGKCTECKLCTQCCPGGDVDLPGLSREMFNVGRSADELVGYVKEHKVTYTVDEKIRSRGSSGGVVTGLLVHLLEKEVIQGAIVVGMNPEKPYMPKGILATTREEIEASSQSKYCITPSMEVLNLLRKAKGQYAVVGLPCQIQGLRKLAHADPRLFKKIYCILGLYCNCTLQPNGHLEAIAACNIPLQEVGRFNFRDHGWPGGFCVDMVDGSKVPLHTINIKNVMNVMFRLFGAKRCYLCIDALAEYSDISFGDFWSFDYDDDLAKLQRCTLTSVRTKRGSEIMQRAVADAAVVVHKLPVERFSKRILNMSRGKISRATVRLTNRKEKGLPVPNYNLNFPPPTTRERLDELTYRFFFMFRGKKARNFVLKILFSPIGVFLNRINIVRKNTFCRYHGN
ncbi:MAG: 4Fe-4S dicluster domain-containing protein [Bacteroidetes bacterium]|nr:4Fe-4S dicluster domain-containing protein [Bacteroidota bacterium]